MEALVAGQALPRPNDPDCLGIAAELVNAPEELRAAVGVLLGQALIVLDDQNPTACLLHHVVPLNCEPAAL
jgi:chromosome segregation ATPase